MGSRDDLPKMSDLSAMLQKCQRHVHVRHEFLHAVRAANESSMSSRRTAGLMEQGGHVRRHTLGEDLVATFVVIRPCGCAEGTMRIKHPCHEDMLTTLVRWCGWYIVVCMVIYLCISNTIFTLVECLRSLVVHSIQCCLVAIIILVISVLQAGVAISCRA